MKSPSKLHHSWHTPAWLPLFAALGALPRLTHAQGGLPLWTNLYAAPGTNGTVASAIAADSLGNVFVTGQRMGQAGQGSIWQTVGYSSTGVPLWTNLFGGQDTNYDSDASAIAVDSSGNVYVTGTETLVAGSGVDYATVAYSGAGIPLWTNAYGGGYGDDGAEAIAVDSSGNVFVTGGSSNGSNQDYATVAYSPAGEPMWTNRYDGANDGDLAMAIAVDQSGNAVVTGQSGTGGGYSGFATISYSATGVPAWTNRFDPPGSGGASQIGVDTRGNVFVVGWTNNAMVTLAYSSMGLPLWTNAIVGTTIAMGLKCVAVDGIGNLFVACTDSGGNYDACKTVAYSGAGRILWTRLYSAPYGSSGYGIAVDGSGNVFVGGNAHFAGQTGDDYITLAYSGQGTPLWNRRYGESVCCVEAIALDPGGNVFVAGNIGSYAYPQIIKYSSSVLAYLTAQRMNNLAVLSWTNSGFALESAPVITGTFTIVPGATSPYTNALTDSPRFFRLAAP